MTVGKKFYKKKSHCWESIQLIIFFNMTVKMTDKNFKN
jgi:hypothetical protein